MAPKPVFRPRGDGLAMFEIVWQPSEGCRMVQSSDAMGDRCRHCVYEYNLILRQWISERSRHEYLKDVTRFVAGGLAV